MNSLKKLICLLISLQIASSKVGGCVSSANTTYCGTAAANGVCNATTGSCTCIATQVGSDCTGTKATGPTTAQTAIITTWSSAFVAGTPSQANAFGTGGTALATGGFTVLTLGLQTQAILSTVTNNVKILLTVQASPKVCAVFPGTGTTAATPSDQFLTPFMIPQTTAGLGDAACSVANFLVLGATSSMAQVAAVTAAQLTTQVADAIAAIRVVQTMRAYAAIDAVLGGCTVGVTALKLILSTSTQPTTVSGSGQASNYKLSVDNLADITTTNGLTSVLLPKTSIVAVQVTTNVLTFNEELNPLLAFDYQSNAVTMFNAWNTPTLGYMVSVSGTAGADLSLTKSTFVANTTVTFTFATTANGNACKYYDETAKTATVATFTAPNICKHINPTMTTFMTTTSKGL